MSKTRLLWHSNSPTAPTGYGQQTALFAPLVNEHYATAISCFYGLEGSPVNWSGIPLLPGLGGAFGNEYLLQHAERYFGGDARGGLVFTLMDVWVLAPDLARQLNMVNWVPVDHDPAPPKVKQYFAQSGATPIAMSRFGQEQLSEFRALYCPHAVNTKAFKPLDQAAVRERYGLPADGFLVGQVAANKGRPSRKGFQYVFEAFSRLRKRHENAYLYLHTTMSPHYAGGEDLGAILEAFEIPENSVLMADQYRLLFDPYSSAQMAEIYSAMDVLVNPSTGGGFEVPIIEAAACGVPSIVTDFTALGEVAGPSPWKLEGEKFWTGQNSWNLLVDVDKLTDALEDAYRLTDKQRRALSRRVRKHAEQYDVERVFAEHMLPAIRKAEKRIGGQAISFDVTEGLMDVPDEDLPQREDGPSISVVVPWYGKPELAKEFWKALDGEDTHEVLVVDNGSDPPVDRAALRLTENLGFCGANNAGLEAATGEAVLFLNNDIALGVQGWLEKIRAALEPGVLVGANMRNDLHTAVDGELHPYLDGWCVAGMKEDLVALGGWDTDYVEPAYYSDNDLCLRAKRAGMKLIAVGPPLVHLENQTAGPANNPDVQLATRLNRERYTEKVREDLKAAA